MVNLYQENFFLLNHMYSSSQEYATRFQLQWKKNLVLSDTSVATKFLYKEELAPQYYNYGSVLKVLLPGSRIFEQRTNLALEQQLQGSSRAGFF